MLIFFAKKIPQMNVTNSCVSQASHLHALRNAVCLLLLVISGKPENVHKLCTVHYTWLISVHAISTADATYNTPVSLLKLVISGA